MKSARIALIVVAVLAAGLLLSQKAVLAHCQIPCGIYGDDTRFVMMKEHIATIEKSMKQIEELSSDPGKNANQIARWVMNKEDHAEEFAKIVTYYFLQQRIKPLAADASDADKAKYVQQLTLCHEMLVNVMKAKQTTDLQYTEKLGSLVDAFHEAYAH